MDYTGYRASYLEHLEKSCSAKSSFVDAMSTYLAFDSFCTHFTGIAKETAGERHAIHKHTDCFSDFIMRGEKILNAPTSRPVGSRISDALRW